MKTTTRLGLLIISLIFILLDQLTKYYVRHIFIEGELHHFLPVWDWTLIYNEGSAFGFLANQGGWQKIFFSLIAIIVSIGIIYYLLKKNYHFISGLAFSFILAGALGNLIDRIHMGKVTDFIFWHIGSHYWPAFNLADSVISVGVALLIIEALLIRKKP